MDVKKVVSELKSKFPGKKVVVNKEDGFLEIICEIEPASKNSKKSLALVVVGKSKKHKHLKTKETYNVVKGSLTVYLNEKKKVLKKGQAVDIKPGVVHWVEGKDTWFYTHSTPGWTSSDHILIE